ncbi:hypothetical protein LTR84_011503 [Exophiala bonariae]|uniref:Uncharacterized protein n=1 Tax=Exophiala bonariae TaxID=1690606 RepID=A0AAV9NJV5_9EURO|nr:hypothetical protein LTR84_011503 [Exophiala bonariae]
MTSGDLRVLELVSHTPKITPGLSSWVMDWASTEGRTLRLPPHLRSIQKRLFDASRSQKVQYSTASDQRTIVLKGMILGEIAGLVPPTADLPELNDTENRSRLIEERLYLSAFDEPLCDRKPLNLDDFSADKRGKALLDTATTLMQGTSVLLLDWYDRAEGERSLNTLRSWVYEAQWRRNLQEAADGRLSHEWKDIEASLKTNTFFVTTDKMLGTCAAVNAALACGDRVAVLYGSDMPVLLRKASGHTASSRSGCDKDGKGVSVGDPLPSESFQFLGVAYVHGLMDGEAMNLVDTGRATVEQITLI